jgi:hypothetical protein
MAYGTAPRRIYIVTFPDGIDRVIRAKNISALKRNLARRLPDWDWPITAVSSGKGGRLRKAIFQARKSRVHNIYVEPNVEERPRYKKKGKSSRRTSAGSEPRHKMTSTVRRGEMPVEESYY